MAKTSKKIAPKKVAKKAAKKAVKKTTIVKKVASAKNPKELETAILLGTRGIGNGILRDRKRREIIKNFKAK